MTQKKNLKGLQDRPQEERKAIARKGALAAAEAKRHKVALRGIINQLLYRPNAALPTDAPYITPIEQLVIVQMQKALAGDTQAAGLILKYVDKWYIGQEHKDYEEANASFISLGNYSGLFAGDDDAPPPATQSNIGDVGLRGLMIKNAAQMTQKGPNKQEALNLLNDLIKEDIIPDAKD